MLYYVSFLNLEKFYISRECIPTFPCIHPCQLFFDDKTVRELPLSNVDIHSIIQSLTLHSKEDKIFIDGEEEGFSKDHFYEHIEHNNENLIFDIYHKLYSPKIFDHFSN